MTTDGPPAADLISLHGSTILEATEATSLSISATANGQPAYGGQLTDREAWKLADLESLAADLRRVRDLCDLWDSTPQLGDLGRSAIWEAATISYGRCFTGGQSRRGKGPRPTILRDELLAKLPPHLRDEHDAVKQMRNEYVGHRIGAHLLQHMTVAVASRPEGPVELIGVMTLDATVSTDIAPLRELAVALLDLLSPVIAEQTHVLLQRENDPVRSSFRRQRTAVPHTR